MNSFTYHVPTQVIFGRGTEGQTGQAVRAWGGSRALVIYGGGSAVASGLLGRVEDSLRQAGVAFVTRGGVHPNPRLSFAQGLVDELRDTGIDFVLGVGGGSVIDTAKAAAIGLAQPDTPIWDFFTKKAQPAAALGVGAVLTIAAAGSETSDSAVLTDEATQVKRGLNCPLNRPRFAIMNPELTYTLPPRQTACGVVDILMHTLDRYFAPDADNAVTDAIAEGILRTALAYGRRAMDCPEDYKARSELMWCGSLSHNGLTGLGQARDFAVHALGHELSAKFDIPHGESLSIMWPAWARHVWQTDPARFARLGRNVWGVAEADDNRAALAAIDAVEAAFRSLDMPVSLGPSVGVQSDAVIRDLAVRCTFGHTRKVGVFHPLEEEGLYQVYTAANW